MAKLKAISLKMAKSAHMVKLAHITKLATKMWNKMWAKPQKTEGLEDDRKKFTFPETDTNRIFRR